MSWGLPEAASTYAGQIDSLYTFILILTGIVFVLTEGALVYFLFRYRAREGGQAIHVHGNHKLELIWSIVPGLVLFGLAIYQYGAWTDIKRNLPTEDEAMVVELAPKQFLWAVRYPGADGQFDTADDVKAPNNVVHVPVNEKVLLRLRAQDVIHSIFVPELRLKQDALPGTIIWAWFEANKTGTYEIACAELCGLGHYTMGAVLVVEEREAFDTWFAGLEQEAHEGADDRVADGGR